MKFLKTFSSPTPIAQSQSTSSASTTTEGRKPRRKDFTYKHGHKVHSYESKAPYPLHYDRPVLELEGLDNSLFEYGRNSVSFVDFDEPPGRVLDLGCGSGNWVIDAANEWPNCQLVGFDLVDVQIPLKILDPSTATRIEWKHGNFLTTQLPFEDDEFDHLHVHAIARAVPENKWGTLFEEICRVLRPGGTVEVIEDDIIFPTLPRWFTSCLRVRPMRGRTYSESTPSDQASSPPPSNLPPHDHALLESLHTAVYSSRFINMKPLSILPSYFTTYFRQVYLGPITKFPMPPLAPSKPLPDQQFGVVSIAKSNPDDNSQSNADATVRASEPSGSTTDLSTPTSTSPVRGRPNQLGSDDGNRTRSVTPVPSKDSSVVDVTTQPLPSFIVDEDHMSTEGFKPLLRTLLHRQKLATLTERSLAMQLYSSYQLVMACQEAMWEELKDRIRNRREELIPFGWDDDEELEELPASRKKFEKLIERYQSDMQTRLSFWRSMEDFGWSFPPRDALTKAEFVEEERVRDSLIEARKQATQEDIMQTCRSMRVIVGHKP